MRDDSSSGKSNRLITCRTGFESLASHQIGNNMTAIVLITFWDPVEAITLVSHGINIDTDEIVVIPQDRHPSELGAKYHDGMGEWVLENHKTDGS